MKNFIYFLSLVIIVACVSLHFLDAFNSGDFATNWFLRGFVACAVFVASLHFLFRE